MGTWGFSYDAVDRLVTATPGANTPAQYIGYFACWSYDSYGNRTLEAFSTAACNNNPTPQVSTSYYSNNRVSSSTVSTETLAAGSFGYDASGNTLYDGNNRYWYDAEGQLCAVENLRWQGGVFIQYIYDAEGARIGKGTLASAPSTYTATCAPPLGSGFTLTNRYLVDLGGNQVTELNGAGVWLHSNVWAGGKLLATYDTKGIHFPLTDPLGTKRVQVNALGEIDETCTSLPFGNDIGNNPGVNCVVPGNQLGTGDDATEHHFTQKERDTETGNDYFMARYYSSALGRFTTPDWSAKVEPVPYAQMGDPQSLNLYAYVRNNPLTRVDEDGHCDGWACQEAARSEAERQLDQQAMQNAKQDAQAQQQMTTSAAGVAFIKGWEGWNGTVDKKTGLTYAKDDGFGNGTIGWGHNCGKCADFAGGITKAEGDALLTKDLGRFESAVNGLGTNLSQQQFDGLVSFAFNVRSFGGSTLFSNVASGTAVTEANFTAYGHARVNGQLVEVPSLMRRRESEYDVYANGVYDSSH